MMAYGASIVAPALLSSGLVATRDSAPPPNPKNGKKSGGGAKANQPPAWLRSSNPGPGPNANQPPPRRTWWANLWWIALVAVIAYNIFSLLSSRANVNPVINIP